MAIELPVLGGLIEGAGNTLNGILGRIIGDKEQRDAADAEVRRVFADLQVQAENTRRAELEAQKSTLLAEIGGQSWMQRNWRPILMLTFAAILANNYIFVPYFSSAVALEFPDRFWGLLQIGVGGYVMGRSVFDKGGLERVVTAYKGKSEE